jgi:electron transfer flavoprotein beta subunit
MKVAVCVKAVPDGATGRRIDPATLRIDRGELALCAYDLQALEAGLRLRDAGTADELVVVSMGPAGAADAIRKALAMGADRAVLVSDEALVGADLLVT